MSNTAACQEPFDRATQFLAVVDLATEVCSNILICCGVAGMELEDALNSTEFEECDIESVMEDIPYLRRVNVVFDIWDDLVRGSCINDWLGVVASARNDTGMTLPDLVRIRTKPCAE